LFGLMAWVILSDVLILGKKIHRVLDLRLILGKIPDEIKQMVIKDGEPS